MKKEELIVRLKARNVSYETKLEGFFLLYFDYAEKIKQETVIHNEDAEEKYIASKLDVWIDTSVYQLFNNVINSLDNDLEDKVNGFVEYYTFLLSSVKNDFNKLMDQLFYIPGQFSKEFLRVEKKLLGETWDIKYEIEKQHEEKYYFSNRGTLEKVPCFI